MSLSGLSRDFFHLFHPPQCPVCEELLARSEEPICLNCRIGLNELMFDSPTDNPLFGHMNCRLELSGAFAFFNYVKGTRVQKLLHAIKYEGRADLAHEMGMICGSSLADQPFMYGNKKIKCSDLDAFVPVPLHRSKERRRGFNQACEFANGLSASMHLKTSELLERPARGSSQTLKDKYERWENARTSYQVHNASDCSGKHLLIVDDVVTTGATAEACAQCLLDAGALSVGIVCLAFAPAVS